MLHRLGGFAIEERWEENGTLLGVMLRAGRTRIGLNQDDWKKGRLASKTWSSLVAAGDKIYQLSDNGETQILTAVWGYEDYDPNLVEVHVSALRRKLEEHGPRLLHTVRGLGYVLRADET